MPIIDIILITIILLLGGVILRMKLRQKGSGDPLMAENGVGVGLSVSNNDVMQYIRNTADAFRPMIEERGIMFDVKCVPESMMGWIDTDKIDKVVLLLLSDMSRNVPAEGKISLEVYTNRNFDRITLRVNDTAQQPLVMSMVIVYQLVHLHHGTLKNEYYKGQGNTVIIELPISHDIASTEQAPALQTGSFNIPTNIELNVPTIELPENIDGNGQSLGALVQQAYISPDQKFLQQAIKCVNEHIDDSEYDRDSFAADMGASASTLYNKLRAVTGKNVSTFIRDIRIQTACRLAKENPEFRVSDIAYRVGFKDPKYFATTFKKVMGTQPKEYFDMLRGAES